MTEHTPMTKEQLAEARAALDEDMSQWGGEYGMDLIREVKRLRALTTVDDAMVDRAARFMWWQEAITSDYGKWDRLPERARETWRVSARSILDAALGTGDGA